MRLIVLFLAVIILLAAVPLVALSGIFGGRQGYNTGELLFEVQGYRDSSSISELLSNSIINNVFARYGLNSVVQDIRPRYYVVFTNDLDKYLRERSVGNVNLTLVRGLCYVVCRDFRVKFSVEGNVLRLELVMLDGAVVSDAVFTQLFSEVGGGKLVVNGSVASGSFSKLVMVKNLKVRDGVVYGGDIPLGLYVIKLSPELLEERPVVLYSVLSYSEVAGCGDCVGVANLMYLKRVSNFYKPAGVRGPLVEDVVRGSPNLAEIQNKFYSVPGVHVHIKEVAWSSYSTSKRALIVDLEGRKYLALLNPFANIVYDREGRLLKLTPGQSAGVYFLAEYLPYFVVRAFNITDMSFIRADSLELAVNYG